MLATDNAVSARDEYLSFRLGEEEYAIDILRVQEIRARESVTRIANMPAFMRGVINLRGTIVPIVDLRIKFGMVEAANDSYPVTIILNIGRQVIGMVVDAVSDVVALKPGELRPAPQLSSAVEAACICGLAPVDGRMLIVVDIARLMTTGDLAFNDQAAA
jgi:purine-binding chemotaxis protein CheW